MVRGPNLHVFPRLIVESSEFGFASTRASDLHGSGALAFDVTIDSHCLIANAFLLVGDAWPSAYFFNLKTNSQITSGTTQLIQALTIDTVVDSI